MASVPVRRPPVLAAGACAVAGLVVLELSGIGRSEGYLLAVATALLLILAALAYLAWHVEPAWLLSGALVLATFNSNWNLWGLPANVAPDRLVLAAGIAAVVLRSPPVRARGPMRLGPLEVVFLATIAWAVASGLGAGTMWSGEVLFLITDRMAVPFAVFLVAPFAFATARQRQVLVVTMVAFGGYVGLTTLFETLGPRALVFPRGIVDASIGYHIGRGRGPFLEGSVNGVGLYASMIFCGIALATWRRLWPRVAAVAVAAVCSLGLVFSLTRSAWVASIVATVVTLAVTRELRRWLIPAVGSGLVVVVVLFAALPALQAHADERARVQSSVWERKNVNAAAMQMVRERPLIGVGLGTFNDRNADYFLMLDDVPQVAELHLGIHNFFLQLLAEAGLIGVALYAASVAGAVVSTLLRRGPPEARPWKIALLAMGIFWLVVANLAPIGQVFPSTIVWLMAGATAAACGSRP